MPSSPRAALRAVPSGGTYVLAGVDSSATPGAHGHEHVQADPLASLQERLYANADRSLLLVLQGMDTSGKDGVVKHVIGLVNPVGVRVTAFRKPTAEELAHDFLWRVRKALPEPGQIAIFNRSHYEDVGIVRVHALVPPNEIERRYGAINDFEAEVAAAGTVVVKCFLHISYGEQRERLLARLDDETKRWKFHEQDLDERALWDEYMAAYGTAIARCSTDVAPWYVIPADHKWYRDWAVARLLIDHLDDLGLEYPQPPLDIEALRRRLNDS